MRRQLSIKTLSLQPQMISTKYNTPHPSIPITFRDADIRLKKLICFFVNLFSIFQIGIDKVFDAAMMMMMTEQQRRVTAAAKRVFNHHRRL
jgi:hypothetical protein